MSTGSIAEQAGEIKRMSADNPAMNAFAAEQENLAKAGPTEGVLGAGAVLPDVDLLGPDGSPQALSSAIGDGLAVLVFYRGAWCPYCNLTLRTYQAELVPSLAERGAKLLAISPQAPEGSLTMQEKNGLEFAVLSDPGNLLTGAVGILTEPLPEVRAAQLGLGLDLAEVNADGTAQIPMPTAAIVDPEREIRWIDVHPDYTGRSEPAEILAALDRVA
ncbi:MAG: AhpC/TSA family protein [Solirubrobacterales bacterium]|nr:AhpC/TSA family protein [Solirubrobacterales bacterium]